MIRTRLPFRCSFGRPQHCARDPSSQDDSASEAGSEVYAERETTTLLRDGYHPEEDFIAEECSEREEAEAIADHYEKIIDGITRQIAAQGGWSAG